MTKQGGDLHQHEADAGAGADADAGGTRWHEDDVWCAEFAHPDKHAGLKMRTPALQRLESLENQSVYISPVFIYLFIFYLSHWNEMNEHTAYYSWWL